ncbi:AAA family ATPase [Microvirga sp. W0021]|uniref:AAA family ATPase n=1 Tax=Hohaiivirga grylli TaxID=3133970 RepID=A0ABV0BIS3_9HYPH
MQISSLGLKNYRRLVDVNLVLDDKKTILVGANNSGKTSCISALHTFLVRPDNLRMRDIPKQNWQQISKIGLLLENAKVSEEELEEAKKQITCLLPSLEVRIAALASEAYRAREILPDLDWNGGQLGVRIMYEPEDIEDLAAKFRQARSVVSSHSDVKLWPKCLFDFIEKGRNITKYFKQRHYIVSLDIASRNIVSDSDKDKLPDGFFDQPISSSILKKLIRVDVISEQRGLGYDDDDFLKGPYTEKQRLNKLLRDYYDSFLNPDDFPEEDDIEVLKMQQKMETGFTHRLTQQFESPLKELEDMGYPGIGGNPTVEITAKISGTDALRKTSSVGYRFDKNKDESLPESYLGLGYQNLIYLTFRLLGFRDKWMRKGKSISSDDDLSAEIEPIHLVLVEEPEVNLHAQVQRVFIEKAYGTLRNHELLGKKKLYKTQLIVSTHSSHIINDIDFKSLRYFQRRCAGANVKMDHTSVENMSELFLAEKEELSFVSKHLKLTHCDIFFADGVIFVEGQAERLLIPEFIKNNYPNLSRRYLSILEVNGAHTHKYKALIEKLGISTLIITDLDTRGPDNKKCPPKKNSNQTTSNYTLNSWYPKLNQIDDLLNLKSEEHIAKDSKAPLYVAFQKAHAIKGIEVFSRTFEDALIVTNINHPHFKSISALQKTIYNSAVNSSRIEDDLFQYVQALAKGDFAFNCLLYISSEVSEKFIPPKYISLGLEWLELQLKPIREIGNDALISSG